MITARYAAGGNIGADVAVITYEAAVIKERLNSKKLLIKYDAAVLIGRLNSI